MNKKILAGTLLGLIIVPLVLIFYSVPNLIKQNIEDQGIQSGGYNNVDFYYNETYVCTNTYIFEDSDTGEDVTFTHKNYVKITWRLFNSTTYELNLTFESDVSPSGYMFFMPTSVYDVNATFSFQNKIYQINEQDIDPPEDSVFITYFQLESMEKYILAVDLNCTHTHNSKYGDQTVSGSVQYELNIWDPTHNDDLQTLFTLLTGFSALAILGLIIPSAIIIRKEVKMKISNFY